MSDDREEVETLLLRRRDPGAAGRDPGDGDGIFAEQGFSDAVTQALADGWGSARGRSTAISPASGSCSWPRRIG